MPFQKRNLVFQFPVSCFDAAATVILSNPDEVGSVEGGWRGLAQHDWLSSKHKNIYLKWHEGTLICAPQKMENRAFAGRAH